MHVCGMSEALHLISVSVDTYEFCRTCPTRVLRKEEEWARGFSAGHLSFAARYTSLYVGKLMQHCFVLVPYDIYEEIMRLGSVLIEQDDDINMK